MDVELPEIHLPVQVSEISIRNLQSSGYFFKTFRISRAALAPEPPVKPAPGWVPEPHRYRFWIGVR